MDTVLLMREGHKLAARGEFAAAIAKYREALQGEPQSPQLLAHLALACAAQADAPNAIAAANDALKNANGEAAIFILAGIALLDCDDLPAAEDAFAAALKLNPENDLAEKYLLLAAWMKGDSLAPQKLSGRPLPDSQKFLARLLCQIERAAGAPARAEIAADDVLLKI